MCSRHWHERLIHHQIHQPETFDGDIFNAGGGLANSVSLAEMTAICQKLTGNKIEIGSETQNRPADLRCFITDNSKIRRAVGWKPDNSVEMILADIFEWIRSNEEKLKPILL